MTEILFFFSVWIALSCILGAVVGRILGQLRQEDSPLPLPEKIEFHQRRQRIR